MKNPFDVLGIDRPKKMGGLSSEKIAEAKQAFRKLSMLYHPDRPDGNEEKFKEIKAAWEKIEGGKANSQTNDSWESFFTSKNRFTPNDSVFQDFSQAPVYIAKVSLQDAFNGYALKVDVNGKSGVIHVPPKTRHEHSGLYSLADGTQVRIITRISDPNFTMRDPPGSIEHRDGNFISLVGNLETRVKVDALDVLLGGWVSVNDFTGGAFSIRVPQGFDCSNFLKAAGRGYYNWNSTTQECEKERADLYVRLIPVFNKLKNIDLEKVKALYEAVQNANTAKS